MTGQTVTLERADGESLERAASLLERATLPTDDIDAAPVELYLAGDGEERVGVGGFELYDTDGLLRSVAVESSKRDEGYGSAIVAALESKARETGVERLSLLTTTASDFFAARGYSEIDRTDLPGRIRETTQFSDLCPSSAACMRKSL